MPITANWEASLKRASFAVLSIIVLPYFCDFCGKNSKNLKFGLEKSKVFNGKNPKY
jgi:hypothetical protein